MLKEMRDASGDSGEFYTPRSVIQFMVKVIEPQLGETVLDPACGTGGFLVETYRHLEKQSKKEFGTVQAHNILQTGTFTARATSSGYYDKRAANYGDVGRY